MTTESDDRPPPEEGELRKLREDMRIFSEKHAHQGFFKYLYYPDIRAVLLYRLSRWCFLHRLKPVAYLLVNLNDLFHGVWIGPNVAAGRGLSLGHPRGLVVNPGTRIGRYCTLINQVTCGGPQVTLGDYVELGAGAKVISTPDRAVHVGAHCIVGAGAVVTRSFEPGSIIAGVPARSIGRKDMAKWCARHPYYHLDGASF
jgi:serine O-acetyltransferase